MLLKKPLPKTEVKKLALQITNVDISTLKEWKDNPRKNDEAAIKLAEVLKEHGQRSPIVVWKKNMVIYKGNTTFKAAKLLGWKKIDVILTDFSSELAAIAYGIADNKTSEFSEWDDSILTSLLKADTEGYLTKERTGFSDKDLKNLFHSEDLPERLDASDLLGDGAAMGEFLVLQFSNTEDMVRFREWMGMGKQERAFLFADMIKIMNIDW